MNRRVNEDGAILAWLLDGNNKCLPIHEEILQSIVDDVRVFCDSKEFVQCLADLYDEQVFVVLGRQRTSVVRELSEFNWILCIYLQGPGDECENANERSKVRGYDLNESELFLQLTRDVPLFWRPSTHLTFRSSSEEASSQLIRPQEAGFMWSQLLLQTIMTIPAPKSKSTYDNHKDAVDECFRFYRGDTTEQSRIHHFTISYTPLQAIYWYSCDTFLYRVVNRALRTQNILVIYKFRFILQDIYRQLKEVWQTQHATCTRGPPITVYRGQLMTPEELMTFKRNIGDLVSLNTFFSTTVHLSVALIFSGSGGQRPGLESVIFEIILDSSSTDSDGVNFFADVSHLSSMLDEKEVLLSMGSTMVVESVHSDVINNVEWIRLRLCSYNAPHLTDLKGFAQKYVSGFQHNELGFILTMALFLDATGETEKCVNMVKLAKRRKTEMGIVHPLLDSAIAALQLKGSSNRMESDKCWNEIATNLRTFEEQTPPGSRAHHLIEFMKDAQSLSTKMHRLEELVSLSSYQEQDSTNFVDDFTKFLAKYQPLIQSFPTGHPLHAQGMAVLGMLRLTDQQRSRQNGQLEAALNQLNTDGVSNHPLRYSILNGMGLEAQINGDEDRALDLYMEMLTMRGASCVKDAENRANASLEIAALLTKRGNIEAAVDFYTNVIDMPELSLSSPYIKRALYQRCNIYMEQKNWSAALADCYSIRDFLQKYSSTNEDDNFVVTVNIGILLRKILENPEPNK